MRFIGREQELALLERLYQSDQFEFLVLYGRRRVGKTELLKQFVKKHGGVFFSAKEKNDTLNLSDFSNMLQDYYEGMQYGAFSDWDTLFSYIASKCKNEKQIVIIDEFPFLAEVNPSIKSVLQHCIDHLLSTKKILLILCGSSISFMEKEIMGYDSPLYGRSTSQLELKEFNYLESAQFFPEFSFDEKMITYGILGGIPCYLNQFSSQKSIEENIANEILRTGAFLKEEPQSLLRMELREPAIYNSILESIAEGATRLNEIATKIHEDTSKCSKYISTLLNLRLIKRQVPCGEKSNYKKGIYAISDNFFLFWYKFVYSNQGYYELMGEDKAAEDIMQEENIHRYMGKIFEKICLEYIIIQAKAGKLPFVPAIYGKWWGNNPVRKCEDDIDILCQSKDKKSAILCECKYTKKEFEQSEYEALMSRAKIIKECENYYYYIFSKAGFTDGVKRQAKMQGNVRLFMVSDLFIGI